ncbi:MAG: CBS domain-containing protein [Proteobacteria bacterium]|nr:CBS domain-containing protein [Pseudomonadota bacterium]
MIGVVAALSGIVLLFAATLRAGGASLIRTSRADALRDDADGVRGAGRVAQLLEGRIRIQPALGTTVTFLIVAAVIPLTWVLTDLLTGARLGVALVSMVVLLVLLVDVIPRWIGRNRAGSLAYGLAMLLAGAIAFGAAAGDLIADTDDDEQSEDDDDAEERELIMSVLEFTDTIVREVMVPRPDMITISAGASTDDAVDIVLSSGRSRIPVTGETIDHVVGILFARDLLELFDQERVASTAGDIAHQAYFVPETKPVSELLREMQANQQHLAVVIDEFGGTAGIATIEDLIEEIVGEIADEFDDEEPMVEEVDGAWIVDARLDVDDLADLVGIDLPSDEWDTVGGLVLELAGRVPHEGERFEHDGLAFTAAAVQGRRVAKVKVTRV